MLTVLLSLIGGVLLYQGWKRTQDVAPPDIPPLVDHIQRATWQGARADDPHMVPDVQEVPVMPLVEARQVSFQ